MEGDAEDEDEGEEEGHAANEATSQVSAQLRSRLSSLWGAKTSSAEEELLLSPQPKREMPRERTSPRPAVKKSKAQPLEQSASVSQLWRQAFGSQAFTSERASNPSEAPAKRPAQAQSVSKRGSTKAKRSKGKRSSGGQKGKQAYPAQRQKKNG